MSISRQSSSRITNQLDELKSKCKSIRDRISELEKNDKVRGHEDELDQEKIATIKKQRLANFHKLLHSLESQILTLENIQEEKSEDQGPTQQLNSAPVSSVAAASSSQIASENNQQDPIALSSDRTWYYQFEKNQVIPTLQRFENNPIDEDEVWNEFIRLSNEMLRHYKENGQIICNLPNYIYGISIVDAELKRLKKERFGFTTILKLAGNYIADKIRGREPHLDGEIGRAIATIKKDNTLENGKTPLIQVKCNAERDFLLLINKFLDFFILSKNPKIKFKSLLVRTSMKIPGFEKILKKRRDTFNRRIDNFENPNRNETLQSNILSPTRVPNSSSGSSAVATTLNLRPSNNIPASLPIQLAHNQNNEAKSSFFKRHKKKILWGLGIGLVVGLSIITGGLIAAASCAAVMGVMTVIGATSTLATIGLCTGAIATTGLLGTAVGASSGVIDDCTSSNTIKNTGRNTRQIYAAANMSFPDESKSEENKHENAMMPTPAPIQEKTPIQTPVKTKSIVITRPIL